MGDQKLWAYVSWIVFSHAWCKVIETANLKRVPSGPLKGFPKASLEAMAEGYIAPWGEVVELMTRIPTVGPAA